MKTNGPLIDKVARTMARLGKEWGENCLFLAQRNDDDKDKATVLLGLVCDNRNDDECYLALRRLLTAFAYRLSKQSNFELEFNVKRKVK